MDTDNISSLVFSPNGKCLAAAIDKKNIKIKDGINNQVDHIRQMVWDG